MPRTDAEKTAMLTAAIALGEMSKVLLQHSANCLVTGEKSHSPYGECFHSIGLALKGVANDTMKRAKSLENEAS